MAVCATPARLPRWVVLILAALTYSWAFQFSPQKHVSNWPLHAAPSLDENLAIAKYTLLRVAAAILSVPSDVFTSPPMLEPTIRSPIERAHRDAVSRILAQSWNQSDGFKISSAEELLVNEGCSEEHLPSTYGEITKLGARQLFSYMKVKEERDIVFYDLGSGTGKLVVQAYAELPPLLRVVGVELAPARHATAVCAWNSMRDTIGDIRTMGAPCTEAQVDFQQGDLFQADVSDATHVYIASLCFTNDMMERVADKLASEALGLRCVATLKEFPKRFQWRFGNAKVDYVEMSWTKPRGEGCLVYFYTPITSIPQ